MFNIDTTTTTTTTTTFSTLTSPRLILTRASLASISKG